MAQRNARVVRVMSPRRCHDDVLARPRQERLERGRASRERDAPGLVGQRDRHRSVDDPRERLDRVELERGEVVEPVEEDRRPAAPPRRSRAPATRRSASSAFARAAPRPCTRGCRAAPGSARTARPTSSACALAGRSPRSHARSARAHARGREMQPLELADEAPELACVAALRRLPLRRPHERREDPLARERVDPLAREPRARGAHLLARGPRSARRGRPARAPNARAPRGNGSTSELLGSTSHGTPPRPTSARRPSKTSSALPAFAGPVMRVSGTVAWWRRHPTFVCAPLRHLSSDRGEHCEFCAVCSDN